MLTGMKKYCIFTGNTKSIKIVALHGCSLLDNAGAHFSEQPLSTINALSLSLLILAEWKETYWNGYKKS